MKKCYILDAATLAGVCSELSATGLSESWLSKPQRTIASILTALSMKVWEVT